jgi:serine/threonine-protein kinase
MSEALPPARRAAERALALDPSLAEAHMAMAQVHLESFEWAEAEMEGRRAIELNPTLAEAQYRRGFALLTSGRLRESVPYFERSRQLDPLWPTNAVYMGFVWTLTGRVEEGIAEARRGYTLDPNLESAQTVVVFTQLAAGRFAEAATTALKVAPLTLDMKRLGIYSYAMSRGGRTGEGAALRARLAAMPATTWGVQSALVSASLGVHDTASAFAAMERAAAGDGDLFLSLPLVSPTFDEVRASPRFAAVLRRFNLDVTRLTKPDGGRSQ